MQRRAEAQQRAQRRNAVIGASLAVVVLAAGGAWAGGVFDSKGDSKSSTPQAAPTPSAAVTPVKGCNPPAGGKPNGKQWKTEPAMSVDDKSTYTATLDTSCGKV